MKRTITVTTRRIRRVTIRGPAASRSPDPAVGRAPAASPSPDAITTIPSKKG